MHAWRVTGVARDGQDEKTPPTEAIGSILEGSREAKTEIPDYILHMLLGIDGGRCMVTGGMREMEIVAAGVALDEKNERNGSHGGGWMYNRRRQEAKIEILAKILRQWGSSCALVL